MSRIGIVEAQARHGFEWNARAALGESQPRAQLALEECRLIVLVVANPVFAAAVRSAPVIDVVRIGVEIHTRDTVLILERAAAVRVRTKPLPRPRAQVVTEPRVHQ